MRILQMTFGFAGVRIYCRNDRERKQKTQIKPGIKELKDLITKQGNQLYVKSIDPQSRVLKPQPRSTLPRAHAHAHANANANANALTNKARV
jgi:hypothetical protein